MAYRPREVVIRAREAAALVLRSLEHDRPVERLLNSYAKEFNRPGRAAHPARYRELLETIGREALLAMVAQVHRELPSRLERKKRQRRGGPPDPNCELFRKEFLAALGQALEWKAENFQEFYHDLELYERLGVLESLPSRPRKLSSAVEGPFVDRCGLLLDPAMLEKARCAAGEFEAELRAAAEGVLKKVFSRRREN